MLNPDFPFDPQEALDEAAWEEFCQRLRDDPWAWIAEAITEADYFSDFFTGMVNNLTEELPNVHPDNRDAHLGRCLRKLVKAYTYPDAAWVADKMADIMADLADESDYRLENNR